MKIRLLSCVVFTLAACGVVFSQIVLPPGFESESYSFSNWASGYSSGNEVSLLSNGFTVSGLDTNSVTYRGTSATGTAGGLYNATGFDFASSGTAGGVTLLGTFINQTGAPITNLSIQYDAFLVNHRDSRLPGWSVDSSLPVDFSGLNWTYGDGDTTLSIVSASVSIAEGESFWISWSSVYPSGSGFSPKIGLNNIRLEASSLTAVPEPSHYAALLSLSILGIVWLRKKRLGKVQS